MKVYLDGKYLEKCGLKQQVPNHGEHVHASLSRTCTNRVGRQQ
jgi:hypothetical protein